MPLLIFAHSCFYISTFHSPINKIIPPNLSRAPHLHQNKNKWSHQLKWGRHKVSLSKCFSPSSLVHFFNSVSDFLKISIAVYINSMKNEGYWSPFHVCIFKRASVGNYIMTMRKLGIKVKFFATIFSAL